MSINSKKTGIMGGTFDPIHLGHLGVASAALEEGGLEEIIFMPAYIQPFKQDRYVADPSDRLNMLNISCMYEDRFKVSTWEIEQETVSYTYDTVMHILSEEKIESISFIMGSDSFLQIEKWYKGKDLLKVCSFIVGLRETNDRKAVKEYALRLNGEYGSEITLLEKNMLPISSSMIREMVINNKPITGLVSPLVEEYIYSHELYI